MKLIEYIGRVFMERKENTKRINESYEHAYRRCFEGAPEEVERKLGAWDWTHRVTRECYGY